MQNISRSKSFGKFVLIVILMVISFHAVIFFVFIFFFSFIQVDFGCEVDIKNFVKCVGKPFFGILPIDKHTVLCMYSTFIVERQSCFIVVHSMQYSPLYMTDTTTCYLACCVVPALCYYICKTQRLNSTNYSGNQLKSTLLCVYRTIHGLRTHEG